jgi:hypothetical protein
MTMIVLRRRKKKKKKKREVAMMITTRRRRVERTTGSNVELEGVEVAVEVEMSASMVAA